jgi:hypothetical protein
MLPILRRITRPSRFARSTLPILCSLCMLCAMAASAQPHPLVIHPLSASIPPPPDSAMRQRTSHAILGLNAGHALTVVSLWTIPGVYDAGILSMMGSKKILKIEYRKRYNEDPDEFGQTGDDAYWQGWAMKGGAIVSFILVSKLTKEPLLGGFAFVVLWLGGTFKHYEAMRMLYEQSRHYENGILDENPPMLGPPASGGEAFKLRLALDF